MTDFLTQLAARSWGFQAAIRPRLAARFEPISGPLDAGPKADWIEEDQASDTLPGLSPEPARTSERSRFEQARQPAASVWNGSQNVHPFFAQRSREPVPGLEEDISASGSLIGKSTPSRMPEPANRLSDAPPISGEGPTDEHDSRSDSSGKGSISSYVEHPPQPIAPPADLYQRRAPAAPIGQAEPARQRDTAPAEVAPPTARLRPEPNVRIQHTQPQQREVAPAQPLNQDQREPDIHITIGRIEVRAVAEARPPRANPTPSGPRVTLEDYLKSRTGGGS